MVLLEADVPGQAADSRHCLELVDDIARYEVDVVVAQLYPTVADPFPAQLVQFGIVHPLDTLCVWGGETTALLNTPARNCKDHIS